MPYIFKILPTGRMLRHMLRNVAVIALPEVAIFELGVLCELFGYDRTDEGLPAPVPLPGAPKSLGLGMDL